MNIRKKIKETVAKIVTEKKGRDVTGPKGIPDGKIDKNDYFELKNIAIKKAKKLTEDDPQTIKKISDDIKAGKINPEEIKRAATKASQGNSDDLAILMVNAMAGLGQFKENKLNEDHEVSMAQSSLDTIIRSATELKTKIGNNEIDIPAWIQDHITNSENYIDQASQGYHEYSNGGGSTEMNEYGEGGYYTNDGSDGDYYDDGSDGDYAYDREVESKAYQLYDKGLELFRQGKIKEAEMLRQQALKVASWLSWGDDELPKYSSNEPQQELDEAMIRRWQHYAGIK
jgi:hypothetical protein